MHGLIHLGGLVEKSLLKVAEMWGVFFPHFWCDDSSRLEKCLACVTRRKIVIYLNGPFPAGKHWAS